MADYTSAQIDQAMRNLGNYRVRRVQALGGRLGTYILALGLRETGLRNIEGGAKWDPVKGKWVPSYDDTGWTQISRIYHKPELQQMPGVKSGTWTPLVAGKTAADLGYVPRFSDAANYTIREMNNAIAYAKSKGIPADGSQTRFAVAAHNAGIGGAWDGYKSGNVDKNTAMGDYSAWVMRHEKLIAKWLDSHPNWKPSLLQKLSAKVGLDLGKKD